MTSASPQVSVLMPVKNAAPFLKDCLDSIVRQTMISWELIAVDDHSTDHSLQLLQSYACRDDRIQVLSNQGRGIIPALRLAYTHARGSFITRMDADDIMTDDKLEVLYNLVSTNGPGHIALGQVHYISDTTLGEGYRKYEKWLNQLTVHGHNFRQLYRECVIPSPCWMLFRQDLDKIGAFLPENYPEDYDLCFRMYQGALKCIPNDKVLHMWRDHPMRSSRNDDHYSDNRFIWLKCHHFIKYDYRPDRPLVVWGAGKKGKAIVRLLKEDKITPQWLCNNPKKWGQKIHDVEMKSLTELARINHPQIIIAVANPDEQERIQKSLDHQNLVAMHDYYFFC